MDTSFKFTYWCETNQCCILLKSGDVHFLSWMMVEDQLCVCAICFS